MSGNSAERENVPKIILALLVSQKDAVPLRRLDDDYKEQIGKCIPWKEFGYISLFDYLKSIPKFCQLERINGMYYARSTDSSKSKHVRSLVVRQKDMSKKQPYSRGIYKPSSCYPRTQRPRVLIPADILSDVIFTVRENPNGVNKEYLLRRVRERLPYVNISIMDLEEQIRDLSHELFVQNNLVFSTRNEARYISSEISTKAKENLQTQNVAATPKYCISGDSDSEFNIDDDNDFSFVSNDSTSNNIKENNKTEVSKKKQPISMLIQDSLSKCHSQDVIVNTNDTSKYNFTKNEQYNGQNNETLDTRKECQDGTSNNINNGMENLVNDRVRFQLEKLIQKYPDGIWCAELPEKFLEEYGIHLNYIELGFNSVRQFASVLPEILQCKQLYPSGDFKLYDAKHELNNEKNKERIKSGYMTDLSHFYQEEEEIEPLPSIVSSDTSNKLMPEGVMVIGETVGQISVVDLESRLQPYVEVFVEEVFTPSLFWVQLRKKKKLFNKLMEDLHVFYEEKSALYKIPLVVLEKGLNCACIYNKQWHRGIIKQVRPDLQVTVMFYDYGTLKSYPPEAVYYLHRSFSYLPAQAIPCGLYNTKPCIGERWSRGVTHEFAFRTTQKPLIATIVSTDPENNSMLVTLTDTMEEEDVHINDWLVQQNLALHGKMGDVVDMSNIMLFVEENLLHHADKCYGKDYIIPNPQNNGYSTESFFNIPLISPQSTLNEKPTKLAPQSSLPTESPNLLTFLQGNSADNNKSVLNPFVSLSQTDQDIQSSKKMFPTNPFLSSMDMCQNHVNNLSPEMFMQIWETNLTFQMQITSIFNTLMTKLDANFKKVNYSLENETKESYEQRLLHASELLESIILKEDISSLLASESVNSYTNMTFDAISNKSNDILMPSFLNSTNFTTLDPSEISDNSISKALLEYLKQVDERNGITLNSTTQIPSNKSSYLVQDISDFTHSPVANNLKIETSVFQGQNGCINNNMDYFHSMWSKQYNEMKHNGLNETNPFKVLLELKDNKCNNENPIQANSLNTEFQKYCLSNGINCNINHSEINNFDNHTSFINKSVLNPFNSECLSTIQKDAFSSFQDTDNVTLQSKMVSQNTVKDQYQFKETCNISQENSGALFNQDYNYFDTCPTIFKTNNVEQLNNTKSSSLDEQVIRSEEFLWHDKSNNRPDSSIFKKLFHETNTEDEKINNSHKSPNNFAETWIRDVENSILIKAKYQNINDTTTQSNSSQRKNVDLELKYCSNREYINDETNDVYFFKKSNVDFKVYNEHLQINADTNDTDCKEMLLKNSHETMTVNMTNAISAKEVDVPYYEFLIGTNTGLTKLFFQTVEMRNKTFCIFHFENEGWLLLNDFMEVFTTYATISEFYKQLQIYNIIITFKEISRFESPTLFFQLDKMQLNVPRDNANKINSIYLMPLKSIIAVLAKLQIITKPEINNVLAKKEFKQHSLLQKASILISTYGKLQSLLKK